MNYIKELNGFYDWLEINSLSTSAIALWHALMHINNKAGWAEEFTVATSVLCIKTGLSDRTIRNARNELKQKGRIDWKSRKGNQAATYKIISFLSATIADNASDNSKKNIVSEINADNVSVNASDNLSDSSSDNVSTLIKLNETKLNKELIHSCADTENLFEQFWSAYPKKRSKGQAEKAWNKINPSNELYITIMRSLDKAKVSKDWTKDGGQFIPYPATWLNAKGWEDEYTPAKKVDKQFTHEHSRNDLDEAIRRKTMASYGMANEGVN